LLVRSGLLFILFLLHVFIPFVLYRGWSPRLVFRSRFLLRQVFRLSPAFHRVVGFFVRRERPPRYSLSPRTLPSPLSPPLPPPHSPHFGFRVIWVWPNRSFFFLAEGNRHLCLAVPRAKVAGFAFFSTFVCEGRSPTAGPGFFGQGSAFRGGGFLMTWSSFFWDFSFLLRPSSGAAAFLDLPYSGVSLSRSVPKSRRVLAWSFLRSFGFVLLFSLVH